MLSTIKDIKRRQAASVTEPATLIEAKAQCIVDHSDDDTIITRYITSARIWAENMTRRSIVEWNIVVTVQVTGPFKLPWGPVRSITSIERRDGATDDDPDWQTLTNEDYRIDGEDDKVISGLRCAVYRITYVAGHTGDAGSYPTPQNIKDGVLEQVAFKYEHRGDSNSAGKFSEGAKSLLAGSIDYSHV